MEISIALNILGILISVLGMLIGFFLIFLEILSGNRKRKIEILSEKLLDLENKKIGKSKEIKNKIDTQKRIIRVILNRINSHPPCIKVRQKEISLVTINYIIFIFYIVILSLSLVYIWLIIYCNNLIIDSIVYSLIFLTIIGFIFLVFASYCSYLKDYSMRPPNTQKVKNIVNKH